MVVANCSYFSQLSIHFGLMSDLNAGLFQRGPHAEKMHFSGSCVLCIMVPGVEGFDQGLMATMSLLNAVARE